uniref:LysM domain-containing protein n=1 Tax=Picea sitchensis TaxID=3332 RepID=B8LMD4_PICSI|nr:unknown [Picea sitchensis]
MARQTRQRLGSGLLLLLTVLIIALSVHCNVLNADAMTIVNRHNRPCEEIYIVGEGETLQTISEKCNAPFILFDNPHIQDTDDIYEGLPLKITSLDTL